MGITAAPIRAMSNVLVTYNGVDITGACNSASLAATINEIETTTLASTAQETTPGQTEWRIECSGPYSLQLDNVCGPDVVSPPAAKRNASIRFGQVSNRVTYTWTAQAYISNYTIDASNPSESISWSGTLVLSGAPARTTG